MRARRTILLTASLFVAGCDKVYFARIDAGSDRTSRVEGWALTPEERARIVDVFQATASELGLHCAPSKYPIITGTYDSAEYQLSWCSAEGDYTKVQLADSASHVTVEIHKIGGVTEPTFFRTCRQRLGEALVKAVPHGKVTVRYPYRWGSQENSQS
jgi:hypothetical protein